MPHCCSSRRATAPPRIAAGRSANTTSPLDELDWDYMPSGTDMMMGMPGMPATGYAKFFLQRGPHMIGHVYHKAIYREYTDATFSI